jgi:hypothetical protein
MKLLNVSRVRTPQATIGVAAFIMKGLPLTLSFTEMEAGLRTLQSIYVWGSGGSSEGQSLVYP